MIGRALVVLALLAGIYAAWPSSPIRPPRGAIAPREPVQTAVSGEPRRLRAGVGGDDRRHRPLASAAPARARASTSSIPTNGTRGQISALATADTTISVV